MNFSVSTLTSQLKENQQYFHDKNSDITQSKVREHKITFTRVIDSNIKIDEIIKRISSNYDVEPFDGLSFISHRYAPLLRSNTKNLNEK